MSSDEQYGAPSVSKILGSIPQILEYLPLLALAQTATSADSVDKRCAAVMGILQFIANKTNTRLDDEFIAVIEPCLKTAEGMALLGWIAAKATAMMEQEAARERN